MSELTGEIPINKVAALFGITPDTTVFDHEDQLKPLVMALRQDALGYADKHQAPAWLTQCLQSRFHMEKIVSDLRHLQGGQEFILRRLKELSPETQWFRGGTLRTWGQTLGSLYAASRYNQEQLNIHVIDGQANGVLATPLTAIGFLKVTPRDNPVLYSLSVDDLLYGLKKQAVNLISEEEYDLRVLVGENRPEYLQFCKDRLKIQRVTVKRQNASPIASNMSIGVIDQHS